MTCCVRCKREMCCLEAPIIFKLRAKVTSDVPFPAQHRIGLPASHWSVNVRFEHVEIDSSRPLSVGGRPAKNIAVVGDTGVVSVKFFEPGRIAMRRDYVDLRQRSGSCDAAASKHELGLNNSYRCTVSVHRNGPFAGTQLEFSMSRNACMVKSNMAALRRIVRLRSRLKKAQQEAAERTYAPGNSGYEHVRAQTRVGRRQAAPAAAARPSGCC